MVDRDVLDRRLARLEELIRKLRSLSAVEKDAYLADEGLQAQAERWLHLAAECAIDLAHHLIADRGWPTPGTYREAFEILHKQAVLSPELTARMQAWAGLRNVLVHLYLEVDHAVCFDILQSDLDDLVAFAAAVQRCVGSDSE